MDFNDALARVSSARNYIEGLSVVPGTGDRKREALTHLGIARDMLATAHLHHIAGDYEAANALIGYHPLRDTASTHLHIPSLTVVDPKINMYGTPEHTRIIGDYLGPVIDFAHSYQDEHNLPDSFSEEDEIRGIHEDAERYAMSDVPQRTFTQDERREHLDNAREVLRGIADEHNIVFGGQSLPSREPKQEPGFY